MQSFRALPAQPDEADHALRRPAHPPPLVALPAAARPADFEAVARGAERVSALEPFLARYVGQCTRRLREAEVRGQRGPGPPAGDRARIHGACHRRCRRWSGRSGAAAATPSCSRRSWTAAASPSPTARPRQQDAGRPARSSTCIAIPGAVPDGMMEHGVREPVPDRRHRAGDRLPAGAGLAARPPRREGQLRGRGRPLPGGAGHRRPLRQPLASAGCCSRPASASLGGPRATSGSHPQGQERGLVAPAHAQEHQVVLLQLARVRP